MYFAFFHYSLVYFIFFYFKILTFLPLSFNVKHAHTVRACCHAPGCTPVLNKCIRTSSGGSRLF